MVFLFVVVVVLMYLFGSNSGAQSYLQGMASTLPAVLAIVPVPFLCGVCLCVCLHTVVFEYDSTRIKRDQGP